MLNCKFEVSTNNNGNYYRIKFICGTITAVLIEWDAVSKIYTCDIKSPLPITSWLFYDAGESDSILDAVKKIFDGIIIENNLKTFYSVSVFENLLKKAVLYNTESDNPPLNNPKHNGGFKFKNCGF